MRMVVSEMSDMGLAMRRLDEQEANLLVNALQRSLDSKVILELDGDLLPCKGLESREDELQSKALTRRCRVRLESFERVRGLHVGLLLS